METRSRCCSIRACILLLYLTLSATLFTHSDARRSKGLVRGPKRPRNSKKLELMSKIMSLVIEQPADTNTQPYGVSSPFTLPPFDSLPPLNSPPYCVNPPFNPETPPSTIPSPPFYYLPPVLPTLSPPSSPVGFVPSPPASSVTPNPPETFPSPTGYIPSPPYYEPSPPGIVYPSPPSYVPSPTGIIPSPPSYVPSPTGIIPSPPVFLPPIVFPPPILPPPSPSRAPPTALWCVAKPSVPDPIIQEAMNYACASGANCDSIQPDGACFEPNTLFAHASYAFNSYFQRTKVAGGTCEFGGTAMLVTVDPSFDGCHFDYF